MITLGSKVKDYVTDFKGIAIARVEYLNGCISIEVQAKMKDDIIPESVWIDEQQLDNKSKVETGGNRSFPPKLSIPEKKGMKNEK